MNRTTSTLISIGLSAFLIAVGIWFIYNHTIEVWQANVPWPIGHHAMIGGGLVMIIFWIVLIVAALLLISGAVIGIRSTKQYADGSSPSLEILKQRYARGEIDSAEYNDKCRDLEL